MDVEAAFPARGQEAVLVRQGEGPLRFRGDRFGAALAAGLAERLAAAALVGGQDLEAAPSASRCLPMMSETRPIFTS